MVQLFIKEPDISRPLPKTRFWTQNPGVQAMQNAEPPSHFLESSPSTFPILTEWMPMDTEGDEVFPQLPHHQEQKQLEKCDDSSLDLRRIQISELYSRQNRFTKPALPHQVIMKNEKINSKEGGGVGAGEGVPFTRRPPSG